MIDRLVNFIIVGVPAAFVVLLLVWLGSYWFPPNVAMAEGICWDTSKWGINTGNSYNPAGLIVRTQETSGAHINSALWTISTVDTDGGGPDRAGPSIIKTSLPNPDDIGWFQTHNFRTGSGNRGADSLITGRFYCNRYIGNAYDSYRAYTVLGFGTENNYGNTYSLSCKEYWGACNDCLDLSNWEEFTISAAPLPGRSGHWTSSMSGHRSGNANRFTVRNGFTTHVTFTWHEDVVIPPDPPTNTLRVRSVGAAGVPITQLSSCSVATGGTTPYNVPTIINICTDLSAPNYRESKTKKFLKWTGCDSVYSNPRHCRADVVGGADQTITAHYVNNTGWIQGYKVRMPGNKNVDPPASELVKLDGIALTRNNPYSTGWIVRGNHTVSVSVPAGWKVGYTLCYKKTNCHNNTPTMASSVVVTVPVNSYADLWWHYYPLDLVVKSVVITNGTDFHVGDEVLVNVTVENDENTKGGTAGAFWVEVCPSGNKPLINCPNAGTGKWTYKEKIPSLAHGVSRVETFSFPAPDPGSYPKTYTLIARADLPDPGNVIEKVEYTNNWGKVTYTVIGPPPWFQTKIGDVGSIGSIEPDDPPQKAGEYSADYLVVSNGLIDKFTSFRKWLVPGYTGINVRPISESGSIYSAFFNKYKPDTSNPIGSIGEIPNTGGERVYFVSGTLVVPASDVDYKGEPAVVFVEEHMNINGNLVISSDTGLIFVVNEYVRIKKKVTQADGVYLFDEDYEVRSKDNSSEEPLVVNGSVLGASDNGNFLLERDFRSADSWEKPTELFIFEPKYLWLFRDTLGDVKTRFEEVSP